MNLKPLRMAIGFTQKQIATELKVGQSAVSMWENGASKPRADTLKKLADLLHCTVDELLEEAG